MRGYAGFGATLFIALLGAIGFWNADIYHALMSACAFALSAGIFISSTKASRVETRLPSRLIRGAFAVISLLSLARLPLYVGINSIDLVTSVAVINVATGVKRVVTCGALLLVPVYAAWGRRRTWRGWLIYLSAVCGSFLLVWAYFAPHTRGPMLTWEDLGLAYQSVISIASLCSVALAWALGASLGRRLHLSLVMACVLNMAGNVAFAVAETHLPADILGHSLMLLAYFVVFQGMIHRAIVEREEATYAELRATRDERDRLLVRLLADREEARTYMSNTLHESIGQPLARITALLGAEDDGFSRTPARDTQLRALASAAMSSIRDLSQWLHPSSLDDVGLVATLRTYADVFKRRHALSGLVAVIGDEHRRPAAEIETALYRATVEALTNVAEHSGASRFGITVDFRGPELSVVVEDDGHGFDVVSTPRGLGLLSMAEGMSQIGGTVSIESGPDTGTAVRFRVHPDDLLRAQSTSDALRADGSQ